jgi:hypothetical protein
VKFKLSKIIIFLPSALVLLTALVGFFRSSDSVLSFSLTAGLTIAAIGIFSTARLYAHSKKRDDMKWVIMPVLFAVGLFGTMAATNGAGLLFALLSAYVMYFYFSYFPSGIPHYVEQTFTLLGVFMCSVMLWSLSFFFMIPWWVILIASFALFFLIFWQAFYKMGQHSGRLILGTLACSLMMAEIFWALLFWPVYFFTSAIVSFAAFYLAYILSGLYFEGRITARKVYFQAGLVLLILLLSLASAAWQPLNRI